MSLSFQPYPQVSSLTNKRIFTITMENDNAFKAILIRHAESVFNLQTLAFFHHWQHLSKNNEYLQEVKYNYNLLDCPITEEGYKQCQTAKMEAAAFKPDLILVSPLNRTLQTCNQIFPHPTCPVIVEPVLSQSVRSSCDYSIDMHSKKAKYPTYNFDKVYKLGKLWHFSNESAENQEKYHEVLRLHESYDQQLLAALSLMSQTWIYETATNLRARSTKVKHLLKGYSHEYKRIAVVSHYNIIRFVLATQFNEVDEPFHCHIGNCEIRKLGLKQLNQ